ncbi:hypothetical protein SODALDRAFT_322403 [Sodiomyces alkalinus F11]|uniref:Deoxycytidylate deaminase n=1 Tax=Sodiomyces alkalinus (strain CBS 110278 / VKM F-3762 / F11) TaxID=1314773 RepID=A0A3N2Q374_SODAK|nr:hypothetical protein SODALDRAFT_322403 [Sodiomyces alkalinus F11]ROT41221.1 hypothetical protein SODALDRAFT_322403 [Sodiomyces alkalinus F11]
MLIGICGGICAGKKTVAQYLVDHHGFQRIYLDVPTTSAAACGLPPKDGNASSSAAINSLTARTDPLLPSIDGTSLALPSRLTFTSPQALLDFVTPRWRDRWVLTDIQNESVLDVLATRPFFLLVSVDAPITIRWRRYQVVRSFAAVTSAAVTSAAVTSAAVTSAAVTSAAAAAAAAPNGTKTPRSASPSTTLPDIPNLESFVAHSDARLYHPQSGLQPLISRATVRLLNTSPSLPHLYATLAKIDLPSPARLRPSWDAYFMALATLASLRSNCMKRRVGAVLVSGAERRVLSTGYNGTPRGLRNCGDGGCPRCNDGGPASASGSSLVTCLCIHAEENALLEAGRERIPPGAVLYCDTCPCLTCSIKICQVGIREVVYAQGYSMDTQAAAVFSEAGVKLRQFVPPPNGLIHLENVEKMELY